MLKLKMVTLPSWNGALEHTEKLLPTNMHKYKKYVWYIVNLDIYSFDRWRTVGSCRTDISEWFWNLNKKAYVDWVSCIQHVKF